MPTVKKSNYCTGLTTIREHNNTHYNTLTEITSASLSNMREEVDKLTREPVQWHLMSLRI